MSNTPKRLAGLILCLTSSGVWQSSRRGGVWRFWSVWRLGPIWRLWCWGGWVRIRWRRRRRWWRGSPVLLFGREHRLHGASPGIPRYGPHHHLFPLYHRLQLSQGMWCLLCFSPTNAYLHFCVCAWRTHLYPLYPLGPSGYLQEGEGAGQKAGVWWSLCHWAAWGRWHQGPMGQTGAQHSVRALWHYQINGGMDKRYWKGLKFQHNLSQAHTQLEAQSQYFSKKLCLNTVRMRDPFKQFLSETGSPIFPCENMMTETCFILQSERLPGPAVNAQCCGCGLWVSCWTRSVATSNISLFQPSLVEDSCAMSARQSAHG